MNNKNLYDLLGNDVSDDEKEFVPPREVVKPLGGSKKGAENPKADKTKARKNRPAKATGNEAGLKHSNQNRSVEAPRETKRKSPKAKGGDKHSKMGRGETAKSQQTKLGDEALAQIEGEEDAKTEDAADEEGAEKEVDTTKYRGFEDYFKEQQSQREALGGGHKAAAAPAAAVDEASLIVKKEEVFFAATSSKKTRTKAKKEKKLVDVGFMVGNEGESRRGGDRDGFRGGRGGFRGDRGSSRGSSRGSRGGFRGRGRGGRSDRSERPAKGAVKGAAKETAAGKQSKPVKQTASKLTEANFPSL